MNSKSVPHQAIDERIRVLEEEITSHRRVHLPRGLGHLRRRAQALCVASGRLEEEEPTQVLRMAQALQTERRTPKKIRSEPFSL